MHQLRTALFVDGANLYVATKGLGFDMDYKKLLAHFGGDDGQHRLVRAFYYTVLADDEEFSPVRPLVDWLDYNGFSVVTKQGREYTDSAGRKKFRGSMDVDLATDMLEMAPRLDCAILLSGNGDFVPAVAAVQRMGVRVIVVSTIRSNPAIASDDLRRQADAFIDLDTIRDRLGKAPRPIAPVREIA
jgi:uncharacterized LabA/DUF88 family protein